MSLHNRTILITGANGGLGSAVTTACLAAGATVIGMSRKISADEFNHPCFSPLSGELNSASSAKALVQEAFSIAGRIDGLVHLVGGFAGGQLVEDCDSATAARMFDLNFYPAFYMTSALLPHMKQNGGGQIIAIGSRTAVEPTPMLGVYSASKAALVSLIKTVALEGKEHAISANIILPGTMDTPQNRASTPSADFSKWVDPRQLASLIVHLLSGSGSQITGATIPVYGADL